MRHYPEYKSDMKDVKRLGAPEWMLNALLLNPSYMGWGPHEDYMIQKEGSDHGWATNKVIPWSEFQWTPDELNLFANWYFNISREAKNCPTCEGSGYHPDAQWISESFYKHSSPFKVQSYSEYQTKALLASFTYDTPKDDSVHGYNTFPSRETLDKYGKAFEDFCTRTRDRGGNWSDDITDDEAAQLAKEGRWPGHRWEDKTKIPTAADYNVLEGQRGFGGHDAINRSILIRQRCKRLGVPLTCTTCDGHGSIYTQPEPQLDLVLWVLHPRKGCGRAVTVTNIPESDVPKAIEFLKECHADQTKNNWQNVLDFNGIYPEKPELKSYGDDEDEE